MKLFLKLIMPMVLVLFVGCSEEGSHDNSNIEDNTIVAQAQKRNEIQTYYDNSEFDTIIEILETDFEYQNAYEDELYKYYLGLAYAGSIGVTIDFADNIIVELSDKNGSTSFSFFTKLSTLESDFNISKIEIATDLLQESTEINCSEIDYVYTIEANQVDTCFMISILTTAKAITVFRLLGEPEALPEENHDEIYASFCAMNFAHDGNDSRLDPAICSASIGVDVTFLESQKTYTTLTVDMNVSGNKYDYMITTTNQIATTNGYCTLDNFSSRDETMTFDTKPDNSAFYVCPIDENTHYEDLVFEDYKSKVETNSSDGGKVITVESIIDYINSSNN